MELRPGGLPQPPPPPTKAGNAPPPRPGTTPIPRAGPWSTLLAGTAPPPPSARGAVTVQPPQAKR